MGKKIRFLALFATFFIVSGCIKNLEERGYATDFAELASIEGSILTKEEVKQKLGSPSTISTFGDETWYYIKEKSENVAFFDPEPISREILEVKFDKDGKISDVQHYSLKDGRKIQFAKDVTPTEGNELGIAEQLLGNLGRFNPKE